MPCTTPALAAAMLAGLTLCGAAARAQSPAPPAACGELRAAIEARRALVAAVNGRAIA